MTAASLFGKERPWLIVRESLATRLIAVLIFSVVLIISLAFAIIKNFPPFVIAFMSLGLLFILWIECKLLLKSFSSNNWLIKLYPEGILLQSSGYLSNGTSALHYLPRSAIQTIYLKTEKRWLPKISNNKKITSLQHLLFLHIDVDFTQVEEIKRDLAPPRKRKFTAGFLFQPVSKTTSGYIVEVKSSRSRTNFSSRQWQNLLKRWGMRLRHMTHNKNLTETLNKADLHLEVKTLSAQGFEMEAIDMLRIHYDLGIREGREKLEAILKETT